MQEKKIKLTFKKDGKTVLKEVSGFEGTGCINATDFIDKALGTVTSRELKHEYYIPEPVNLSQEAQVIL